jgi:hypothetical protein
MASSGIKRAIQIPAWSRLPLAGYGLLLVGEVLRAPTGAAVIRALVMGLLAAPLGIVIVIAAVGFWLYDQIILSIRGVRTTATIEGFYRKVSQSSVQYASYRYRPLNGEEMINSSSIGVIFPRGEGTEVVVRYDPKCPQLVAGLHFPIVRTIVGLFL